MVLFLPRFIAARQVKNSIKTFNQQQHRIFLHAIRNFCVVQRMEWKMHQNPRPDETEEMEKENGEKIQ